MAEDLSFQRTDVGLVTGCAASSAVAPDLEQNVADSKDAEVSRVEYDEEKLAFLRELASRQFGHMFFVSRGYGPPPEAELIEGELAV